MNWFLIALLAPALWSVCNHIDKYLIGKYFKGGGTGSLLIFSSLIGVFVLPIIFVFHPEVLFINPVYGLLIALNGAIYITALIPYIYALEKDEASIVMPLYQTVPIFSYILAAVVLKESLTLPQLLASSLIIAGAIFITLDLSGKKVRFKKEVFGLILLSAFLVSLNGLIFKFVALKETFWTTSFWEYIGFAIFAVLLFTFVKSYRQQFLFVIKRNKIPVIGLNGFNEIINIIGKLSMNFAMLLAPLALAWVVNGFQPFFVLLYGIILTVFFPKLGRENLSKKHLSQKIFAIALMFLGSYLLNR